MIGPLNPEEVIKLAIHSATKVVGHANACDIAQDTWIKYQQHAEAGWPILRARGWVWRVARNLAFDSSRRRREIPSELFDFDITFDPCVKVERQESDSKQVKELLDTLSEENRQMLQMRYFDDMSWLEVSKIMGKSENAVRCRFHQIKKRWTSN